MRLKPRGVGTASDRGRRQNGGRERGRGGGGVAQTWADCESALSVRLPLTIHLRLSGFFSSVSFVLVCFPLSCTRLYSLPLIKSLSLGVFASPFMLCSLLSLPFHFNSSSLVIYFTLSVSPAVTVSFLPSCLLRCQLLLSASFVSRLFSFTFPCLSISDLIFFLQPVCQSSSLPVYQLYIHLSDC